MSAAEAVKVIVRCRPMNERENRLQCEVSFIWTLSPWQPPNTALQVVLNMDTQIGQVQLIKPKPKDAVPKLFTFDGVYYTLDTTEQIYEV